MSDIGTKYKYFDYDDLPARILAPGKFAEVWKNGVGWKQVTDHFDFLHRYVPITEERAEEMIANLKKLDGKVDPKKSS